MHFFFFGWLIRGAVFVCKTACCPVTMPDPHRIIVTKKRKQSLHKYRIKKPKQRHAQTPSRIYSLQYRPYDNIFKRYLRLGYAGDVDKTIILLISYLKKLFRKCFLRRGKGVDRNKTKHKCIMAITSAILPHAADTAYPLSSPCCRYHLPTIISMLQIPPTHYHLLAADTTYPLSSPSCRYRLPTVI